MEDRRRRRVAFENLAKEVLRYLDDSDDVKVGITELQERVEVPVQNGISVQQEVKMAKRCLKHFRRVVRGRRFSHVLTFGLKPSGQLPWQLTAPPTMATVVAVPRLLRPLSCS